MATILLPTDFSDNALNAARFATELFDEPATRFVLLNAVVLPQAGATIMKSMDAILAKEAKTELLAFEKKLGEDRDLSKFTMERHFELGDVPAVIDMLEEVEQVDLIVMGTQGATGIEEVFMGSTTSDVIKRVEKPSLAIPANAKFKAPQRIVLADDGEEIEPETTRILVKIARKYDAKIMVVRMIGVDEDEDDIEPSASDFDDLFDGIEYTEHLIVGDDLDSTLDKFVLDKKVDMVAMVHHHLNLFEQLFHRSATKRMAMHSHVPLLVLQQ